MFLSLVALVTSVGHACAFAQDSEKYFRKPPEGSETHEAALDTMLNELVLDDPNETLYDGNWKRVATIVFYAPFPTQYARRLIDQLEDRGLIEIRTIEPEEIEGLGEPEGSGQMAKRTYAKETYEGLARFDRWQEMKDSYGPPDSGQTINHSGLDTIRLAPPGALKDGLITGATISAIPLAGAAVITIVLAL